MEIIGITGTNGKTSCTYILKHLLGNKRIGIIGTLGAFVGDKKIEYLGPQLTTPDRAQLDEIFEKFKFHKVKIVVMEVSAHAIAQNRIQGINFRVGCFTNLSHDHLDYFKTFENYAKTKVDWVSSDNVQVAVVNYDDAYGRDIIHKRQRNATPYKTFRAGANFIESNVNACVEIALELGIAWRKIQKRVKTLPQVPGRFNVIKSKIGYTVVIDYAHTPDGLEKVLKESRSLVDDTGKLIVVFGCGGDRDAGKRPIMGQVAKENADLVVVTSDNPRTENPMDIIEQIGVGDFKFEDRLVATHFALRKAQSGDVVVLAGKGAENTQEINGNFLPYNDTKIVTQYLRDTKQ